MAIPNGGAMHIMTGRRLKLEGVRPGIPDLFLAIAMNRYHGLWIEMKRRRSSVTAKEQSDIHEILRGSGYAVSVCRGWDSAKETIERYLNITKI